jgi:putative PIN family toxin of toxin-antitoxin system
MNVLVDTNVLLSAALRNRLPERVVIFVATNDSWKWLVTDQIVAEYTEVLKRPKFGFSDDVIAQWSELLSMRTVNIGNPPSTPEFPRDPKDAPFLAAALFGQAEFLITGDKDLLSAAKTIATRVVTVTEFAAEFQLS